MDKWVRRLNDVMIKIRNHRSFSEFGHRSFYVSGKSKPIGYYTTKSDATYFTIKFDGLTITSIGNGEIEIRVSKHADYNIEHLALYTWFYRIEKLLNI